MIGKVFPEGNKWTDLASHYIAEFGDLAEIESRWSQYKILHPVLVGFNQTVAEIMTASFAELVAISQQFRNLPNRTEDEKRELRTIRGYLKKKVFNYDCRAKGCKPHQGVISKFFQKKMEELNSTISPGFGSALGGTISSPVGMMPILGRRSTSTDSTPAASMADNNSLSPTFLIQAGEILESQGKKDEALKLYQEVKEKYFNSMQYQIIDAYIERCK